MLTNNALYAMFLKSITGTVSSGTPSGSSEMTKIIQAFVNNIIGSSGVKKTYYPSGNNNFSSITFSEIDNTSKTFKTSLTQDVTNTTSASSCTVTAIRIGSGKTPATLQDFKLEEYINLNPTSTSLAANTDDLSLTAIATFYNNTDSSIDVNEIGWFSVGSSSSYGVLMFRHVFDNTITIGVGQSKSFSITINFSANSNVIVK